MDKFVLIDGNSLLNRAFYAMSVFTTKDGLPTNGIFGFSKLLFKILDDEQPAYLAVAFDVHAPTFRHKLFSDYKGTRKPMPEELVRQVPVLKDLLRAMGLCTVELAGYEADDLIGTLSQKFPNVHMLIYTGDRDSYQLVSERVDVCFTKRGVSDLDRLTAANFYEKVSLTPAQIIEEKALMGDSSDNIPGVHGVGPKSALELLHTYSDLDGVYAHLDEIKQPALRKKLEEGRESAYLSRTLATIDTAVPLTLTLEDCKVELPFPAAARTAIAKLEFRSLVDLPYFSAVRTETRPVETVVSPEALYSALEAYDRFAFCMEPEGCYFATEAGEYFVPVKENFLGVGVFLTELVPVFEKLFSGTKRAILPDYKAVAHAMAALGVEIACPVEDVSLLRYLGDSNLRPVGAKELAKDYDLAENNCAGALLRAFHEAEEKTAGTAEEKLYRELELPLAKVLFSMERAGVTVDCDRFSEFSEKFCAELEGLTQRIYMLAGTQFNLNSPSQLSEILFEQLGFAPKGIKRTARGYSTNADVLEKLAEEHEIAQCILDYRAVQKLQSTYIDGIRPLVKGGVIHTTYNQTATTTGRLSSTNPNLQNIPIRTDAGRELRKLFIASEGNILIDADYSQIELRLLAHFSGCKALIEAYGAGEDIHAATAARVFGVSLGEVTPAMRRKAKSVNFGIIYGMSAFGLAKDIGVSTGEAQQYIDRYFAAHPEVKAYMEENVRRAREDGYVTTVLGRKRYIPEIKSANFNTRSFGERAAMNMPLQGSAADIIKIAMLRVASRLETEGLRTRLVLQVHDELVLDAPEEEADRAAKLLKEEMEGAVALKVPLIAEVSRGRSWYDAK